MRILATYGRVIGSLGRDRWLAVFLVAVNLLVAGLQFLDPVLFGRVIQMLANSKTTPPDALWAQAVKLLGIWAAVGVTGILASIVSSLQSERMAHRHRLIAMRRYYEHVLSLPLSFHGDAHSGRLMKLMLSGVDAMFWLWLTFFRDQLSTFVAVLVLLPMTMLLNWRLALSLIVVVVLFCVLTTLVIRKTQAGQAQAAHWQVQLAGTVQDTLANVTVVQSFTRLGAETTRFGEIADQVIKHQFPVLTWWAIVNVATKAASTIAVISIVVIGTVLNIRGQANVGEIVSFMGFATLLIGKMDSMMAFVSKLFFEMPGLQEFFAVLDTESTVPDRADAHGLAPGPGEVVFEDVVFGYPGGPPVLAGVSFTARPGTSVALVGPTGAGKSTAMAMLQRLWDPRSGRITIDGQDLRDLKLESLRRSIGVVFQESMLLNRSIRENVMLGKPDATPEQLERACRMAEAHDFILRQPNGYDTVVGERGATLSGGQRQRLSIARALLKDPPILILDEATSALDAATEARVGVALAALMAGRTTFIIAHRLSTVRDADEILVFEGGTISERGRFGELLALHGRFADLVATQLAHGPG